MVIYLLLSSTRSSLSQFFFFFFPVLCEVGRVPRNNRPGCDWWRAERSGPSWVTWPSEVWCLEVLCDNSRAVLLATVLLGASFIMSVGSCSAAQRGLRYHLDEITAVLIQIRWWCDIVMLLFFIFFLLFFSMIVSMCANLHSNWYFLFKCDWPFGIWDKLPHGDNNSVLFHMFVPCTIVFNLF